MLGDGPEEGREDGERDVRMDAVRRPVKDWSQLQTTLRRAPGDFDALQLLVAEREIGSGQGVVVVA